MHYKLLSQRSPEGMLVFFQLKIDELDASPPGSVLDESDLATLFNATQFLFSSEQFDNHLLNGHRLLLGQLMERLFSSGDFRKLDGRFHPGAYTTVTHDESAEMHLYSSNPVKRSGNKMYLPMHECRERLAHLPRGFKASRASSVTPIEEGVFADFYEHYHTKEYLEMLRNMKLFMASYDFSLEPASIGFLLDERGDTFLTPSVVSMINFSNAALKDIAEQVKSGKKGVFAPLWVLSGHHAMPGEADGFCIVNHAMALRTYLGSGNSLVCDLDIHASVGDPDDEDDPMTPYTLDFTTAGQFPQFYETDDWGDTDYYLLTGTRHNVRVVMKPNLPKGRFVEIVREVGAQLPRTNCLILSNGFDTRKGDPTANLGGCVGQNLGKSDFRALGELLSVYPQIVVLQEGGYKKQGVAIDELIKCRDEFLSGLRVLSIKGDRKRGATDDVHIVDVAAVDLQQAAPVLLTSQKDFEKFIDHASKPPKKARSSGHVSTRDLGLGDRVVAPYILAPDLLNPNRAGVQRQGFYAGEVTSLTPKHVTITFAADGQQIVLSRDRQTQDTPLYTWESAKELIVRYRSGETVAGNQIEPVYSSEALTV